MSCYQKLSTICPSSDLWLGASLEIKVKVAEMVFYLIKWNWSKFEYFVSWCYKFFLEFSSWKVLNVVTSLSSSSSSSSPPPPPPSSSSYHSIGPLVELFQYHTSRSLFSGLPCFLLPFVLQFFIIISNIVMYNLIYLNLKIYETCHQLPLWITLPSFCIHMKTYMVGHKKIETVPVTLPV